MNNSPCNAIANPGYNGSSTGYYSGGSCGAQTRDVQEGTLGYWYDFYKGERGRLRQGFQYSYVVREAWSGASGVGAKGIENMIFTSIRYFLPYDAKSGFRYLHRAVRANGLPRSLSVKRAAILPFFAALPSYSARNATCG